jgi:hypothetical protein
MLQRRVFARTIRTGLKHATTSSACARSTQLCRFLGSATSPSPSSKDKDKDKVEAELAALEAKLAALKAKREELRKNDDFPMRSDGTDTTTNNNTSIDVSSSTPTATTTTMKPIYVSKFGRRIKFLRRFSAASAVASTGLLGMVAAGLSPSSMAIFGQYVIAGTGCFASVGGTALLVLVTSPYVTEMFEMEGKGLGREEIGPGGSPERRFKATTLNILGMERYVEFNLSDAVETIHPFASFKVGPPPADASLYVFGGDMKDDQVRNALTKERDVSQ